MRVGGAGAATERRPPPGMPPAPNVSRFSEETNDVVRVIVGTDTQTPLDLFLAAQKKAGEIRARMKEVQSELADYKARYWAAGNVPSHFDIDRKALLSRIKEEERARSTRKLTEAALDDYAHADRRYLEFTEKERQGRWQMERLQSQVSGLQLDLETALGVVEYYRSAIRVCEEMIRFARSERQNTF